MKLLNALVEFMETRSDTFTEFARVHVLEYVLSRTSGELKKQVSESLRRLMPAIFEKLLQGYEEWINRHFHTWDKQRGITPEKVAREYVEELFDMRLYRDKMLRFDGSRVVFSDGEREKDMTDSLTSTSGLSARDTAVVLGLHGTPVDMKELRERVGKTQIFLIRSKLIKARKEIITDFYLTHYPALEDLASLLDDARAGLHRDKRVYGSVLLMYEELLQWKAKKVKEWGSLMSRALQVAHVTDAMGSYVGLSQEELEDMNYIEVLPPTQVAASRYGEGWWNKLYQDALAGIIRVNR